MQQQVFRYDKEYLYLEDYDALDDGVVGAFIPRKGLYMLKVLMRYARKRNDWIDTILSDSAYIPPGDEDWDAILATIAELEGFLMSAYDRVLADTTLEASATYIDVTGLNYLETGPWILTMLVNNPKIETVGVSWFVNTDYTVTNYYTQVLAAINGVRSSTRNNNALFAWNADLMSSVHTGMIARNPRGYVTWLSESSRYGGTTVDYVARYVSHFATQANITSIRVQADEANGLGVGTRLLLTRMGV